MASRKITRESGRKNPVGLPCSIDAAELPGLHSAAPCVMWFSDYPGTSNHTVMRQLIRLQPLYSYFTHAALPYVPCYKSVLSQEPRNAGSPAISFSVEINLQI